MYAGGGGSSSVGTIDSSIPMICSCRISSLSAACLVVSIFSFKNSSLLFGVVVEVGVSKSSICISDVDTGVDGVPLYVGILETVGVAFRLCFVVVAVFVCVLETAAGVLMGSGVVFCYVSF